MSGVARLMAAPASRKEFIRYAGLSGIAAAVLAGCTKAISNDTRDGTGSTNTVSLGTGDTGILNFAYALEQLEAAFYTVVAGDPYENIDSLALSRLTDIRLRMIDAVHVAGPGAGQFRDRHAGAEADLKDPVGWLHVEQ